MPNTGAFIVKNCLTFSIVDVNISSIAAIAFHAIKTIITIIMERWIKMAVNPFTPGRTVDPQFFAGRESEIDRFTMFLKSAKDGNPMNLAVGRERNWEILSFKKM